jgi:hypothetical protein
LKIWQKNFKKQHICDPYLKEINAIINVCELTDIFKQRKKNLPVPFLKSSSKFDDILIAIKKSNHRIAI